MGDWNSGRDAATMKPRFVPDAELHGRDDGGGPDWDNYTQQWGDGGRVTGAKAHLSVSGGATDPVSGGEVSAMPRQRRAREAAERTN